MLVKLTFIRPMFPSIGKVNLLTYDRNIGLIWVDKMTMPTTNQLAKNLAQFEEHSDKKNSNIITETLITYCNAALEFFNKL